MIKTKGKKSAIQNYMSLTNRCKPPQVTGILVLLTSAKGMHAVNLTVDFPLHSPDIL